MSDIITVYENLQRAIELIKDCETIIADEGWDDATNYDEGWVAAVVHPAVLALSHARRNLERVQALIDGDVKEMWEQLHIDDIAMDYDE